MEKYALYARVSTIDKGQNPEIQLVPMRKRCEREGWKWVEFIDKASAFKDNPDLPNRDSLLERARKQEFDGIMVWAVDRWSREDPVKVTYQILYEIKKGIGIDFISLNEPFLSTNAMPPDLLGLFMQFTSWASSHESRRKSERIRAAYELKKGQNGNGKVENWGRPEINVDLIKLAEMKDQGMSIRKLAQVFHITRGTIYNRLKKLSKKGSTIFA